MALFKILSNMTDPANNRKSLPNTYHQGYCYFDVTTGKFYIDTSDVSSGRMPLNAEKADKDMNGDIIHNTYGRSLIFNQTSNQVILKGYNNANLSTITLGALASMNAISTTYQPAGSNTKSALVITPTTGAVLSSVNAAGSFPTFTSSVDANGVLSFSHSGGSFPTFNTTSVWVGYNNAITASYAEPQTFTGTTATLTLSPVEGEAQNGDNRDF